MYRAVPKGKTMTTSYRVFFTDLKTNKEISPWHDIPLFSASNNVHMVLEIPAFTRAKFEVATKEHLNPIRQDINKSSDTVRYLVPNTFFDYGCVPQTLSGDGDPLDTIDITNSNLDREEGDISGVGEVYPVKVLGGFCLFDHGEDDWKVLCVREDHQYNNLEDIPKDLIEKITHWFKTYKVHEGKEENIIKYDEKIFNREEVLNLINESHKKWIRVNEEITTHGKSHEGFC
jgi:inorganic pyrophosphatase